MKIIPAIDIIAGRCVRLTQGDYGRVKRYAVDPVVAALQFRESGASCLQVIDLDGAKFGYPKNEKIIKKIFQATGLPITVGGGIRDLKTAKQFLDSGFYRVILSTAVFKKNLVKNLIANYGAERIVVAVDVKDGQVMTRGWRQAAGMSIDQYLKLIKAVGINQILLTDVVRDGTLSGPNFVLASKVIKNNFKVTVAGGITTLAQLRRLNRLGADGAVIGKAAYEGQIDLVSVFKYFSRDNLAKRIIPCLDIKDGLVVKGKRFQELAVIGDAVELAKSYSQNGADELVFLDIAATIEKRKTLITLVQKIAKNINIPFTVGGGINSLADVKKLLAAGADKVSLGSAAVRNPNLVKQIARRFGSQCLVISLDAKRYRGGWRVFIDSGRKPTGIDAVGFARLMEKNGAGELLVNSLDRDGTKRGFDVELLKIIAETVKIPVIASSGAGSKQDFLQAITLGKADAVLAASVFHYGQIGIKELKKYLKSKNINVRI